MFWEGLLIVSKSHYEAMGPDRRFILTKEVREHLHPEVPAKYLNKSIIVFGDAKGNIEYEVEGQNFLAVSSLQVREFLTMSPREAERRYADDYLECKMTGSSMVAKLYQMDQEERLADLGIIVAPKKKGLLGRLRKQKDPEKKGIEEEVRVSKPAEEKPRKTVKKVPAEKSAEKKPAAKKPAAKKAAPKKTPESKPVSGTGPRMAVSPDSKKSSGKKRSS
ncbi:hypothetical protein TALC_00242 [Thermoplasmatales archaeon BRNA1]|nr:hypothetical protein TALC_00242 [Thermoplasmatales archaeon BRNA1]